MSTHVTTSISFRPLHEMLVLILLRTSKGKDELRLSCSMVEPLLSHAYKIGIMQKYIHLVRLDSWAYMFKVLYIYAITHQYSKPAHSVLNTLLIFRLLNFTVIYKNLSLIKLLFFIFRMEQLHFQGRLTENKGTHTH